MAMQDLLTKARLWIRRSENTLDGEILQTLEAGWKDMEIRGILNMDASDALVQQALKLYLKSEFGFGDEKGKFKSRYEDLRDAMSLSSDYNTKKHGET